jgi:hypothetical protein
MIRRTSLLLCLAILALDTGCYMLPPLRVGAGGGGGAGAAVTRDRAGDTRRHAAVGLGQLRPAITPLALGPATARRADLSLGWTLDWATAGGSRNVFRHGPFVEGVWFARQGAITSREGWRLGPTAMAEIHLAPENADDDPSHGFGFAGGILLEYAEAVRGPIFLGAAHGDLGIGLAGRIGVRREDGGTYTYAIFSVEVRWPGIAGIGIPTPRPR